MKKSKFSDSPIVAMLRRVQSGVAAPELCRGWASTTGWTSLMARMRELEAEMPG